MFEYVIVLFAKSTVTTIIGFADNEAAQKAFNDSCINNAADWGYLYRGDGMCLGRYGVN